MKSKKKSRDDMVDNNRKGVIYQRNREKEKARENVRKKAKREKG